MTKFLSILLPISFLLLSSCSLSRVEDSKSVTPINPTQESTKTGGTIVIPEMENISKIQNIKTQEDINAIYPNLKDTPSKRDPNSLKLEKDQVLLSQYIIQIKNPEVIVLRNEQMDILEGKVIWTKEINELDQEYTKIIISPASSSGEKLTKINALDTRNAAIKKLQNTKEYKDYITSQQVKLKEISIAMKAYWTPEMITLQKEIDALRKEIYAPKNKGNFSGSLIPNSSKM